jgi:hypothetical protein
MRLLLPLLTCTILVLAPLATRADEPPEMQLEFVRKLRAKGYSDLALEYLEILKKNPTPGLAPLLAVEIAQTKVSSSRNKGPTQRLAMLNEARTELEKALQTKPGPPEAAKLRLAIARIASYQGQALLSKALQSEDASEEEVQGRKAEQQFAQAGKELEAAAKGLEDLQKSFKATNPEQEAAFKKKVGAEVLQARLERGRNYLDQAATYINATKLEVREKRGNLVEEGRKILEAVAKDPNETSPETSYLAYAWLIKVAYDSDAPKTAHEYLDRVLATKGKEAQPARRLARLLFIQNIMGDPLIKETGLKKLKFIEKATEEWLSAYPSFKDSPEGQAVRYELASSLVQQALAASKDLKTAPAKRLAGQAQKILTALGSADSEYSRKARQLSVQISVQSLGSQPVAQLKTFSDCFLKAQVEMAKVDQSAKAPEQRKEHLATLIEALERALKLADAKTSVNEVNDVHFFLAVAHMLSGDLEKAAAESENVARLKEPSSKSPLAAAYALRAYGALAEKDDSNEAIRKRLRDLAMFIVTDKAKVWQSEPVLPVARYQLALMAMRDRNHAAAVEHLEKLPPDFAAYTFGQCQAAFEALNAAKDAKTDAEKTAWRQRALAALRRVPQLPPNPDSATVQMYFAAQIEQGKLLYEEGATAARKGDPKGAAAKYADMVQFIDRLEQQFQKAESLIKEEGPPVAPKGKDGQPPQAAAGPRQQLRQAIGTLKKYGLLGASDLAYRAGNFDGVLSKELTGGVLAQVQALGKTGQQIALPDYQITGDILGLALRAQVQKGDINGAKATLDLLQRLTGPGEPPDPGNILRSLLGELQSQLKDLRAKGDQAKLKQTIGTFTAFIDVLAQSAEKSVLKRNDIIFLANCYNSLEQYDRAAKLYGLVKPPVADPKQANNEKYKQDFDKEKQAYWLMQVLYGAALRKNKQIPEAKKVLEKVLSSPDGAGKLVAEKEMNIILEDQGLYGTAIKRWGEFMSNPTLKKQVTQYEEAKKVYFEAYYHYAYCWYKYSQGPKVKGTDKEKKFLQRSAEYMLRLEKSKNGEGWRLVGPQFEELLRQEPALNAVYQELKSKSP